MMHSYFLIQSLVTLFPLHDSLLYILLLSIPTPQHTLYFSIQYFSHALTHVQLVSSSVLNYIYSTLDDEEPHFVLSGYYHNHTLTCT